MLTEFGPYIWITDGPVLDAMMGFHYPTRMVVIRLVNGDLVLWSPVELSPQLADAIAALGTVRHLIAPNHLHHVYLGPWAEAFPDALVHAAPGLADKRPDLRIDAILRDTPHADWVGQIDQITLPGNRIMTEIVFFHRASGTVIFTDLLQQFPTGWFKGWRGVVAWLDKMTGDRPNVPRKFRIAFSDKPAARRAVEAILDWPIQNLVMAHGTPVQGNGREMLRHAFAWLKPGPRP